MAAFASITVNDRESSPVAHTFAPQERKDGIAVFSEAGTIPAANKTLTASWRRQANGNRKVRLVLAVPVEVTETINGVNYTRAVRPAFADVTFTFPSDSTLQERKNVVGMLANALDPSVTVLDGTITGTEGIY